MILYKYNSVDFPNRCQVTFEFVIYKSCMAMVGDEFGSKYEERQ